MMSLDLPPQDSQTLAQIEAQYGIEASNITLSWVHSILQYYRTHKQLPFFSVEIRTCQGCSFLIHGLPRPDDDPPNVIRMNGQA